MITYCRGSAGKEKKQLKKMRMRDKNLPADTVEGNESWEIWEADG